jgi:hypothetical protein
VGIGKRHHATVSNHFEFYETNVLQCRDAFDNFAVKSGKVSALFATEKQRAEREPE